MTAFEAEKITEFFKQSSGETEFINTENHLNNGMIVFQKT